VKPVPVQRKEEQRLPGPKAERWRLARTGESSKGISVEIEQSLQDTHASEFAVESVTSSGFVWKQNSRAKPTDVLERIFKEGSKRKQKTGAGASRPDGLWADREPLRALGRHHN